MADSIYRAEQAGVDPASDPDVVALTEHARQVEAPSEVAAITEDFFLPEAVFSSPSPGARLGVFVKTNCGFDDSVADGSLAGWESTDPDAVWCEQYSVVKTSQYELRQFEVGTDEYGEAFMAHQQHPDLLAALDPPELIADELEFFSGPFVASDEYANRGATASAAIDDYAITECGLDPLIVDATSPFPRNLSE